jgi:sulfite oxidase
MNGEPLTKEHGFPVRVIVPGIAGARSVKWLDRITVQTVESSNYYQQHDYKILPLEAVDSESAEKFWDTTPALQTMPVNSAIAIPEPGSKVERSAEGMVTVKGFALPGGDGGAVVKVEVSGDEGKTWLEAEIEHDADESKWSWRLWKAVVKVEAGKNTRILSRATDQSGGTQPERSQWNLRGVAYNGYGETTELEIV